MMLGDLGLDLEMRQVRGSLGGLGDPFLDGSSYREGAVTWF